MDFDSEGDNGKNDWKRLKSTGHRVSYTQRVQWNILEGNQFSNEAERLLHINFFVPEK